MALATAAHGCTTNHHVSPFPVVTDLRALVTAGDLDAEVARIDEETRAAGLVLDVERRGALRDATPFVLRGYRGTDALGRPVHATRVATPRGVVLALGPPDPREPSQGPSELVIGLAGAGWASGTDLNGDGAPDVLVRDGAGAIAVWRIDALGASPISIRLIAPATRALDIDEDGQPDLAGAPPASDDALAPALLDVATFTPGGYDDTTPAARAWHAKERDRAELREREAVSAKQIREACRAALERAFHARRAGDDEKAALAAADRLAASLAPLPDGVQQAWVKWRGWIGR